MLTYLARRSVYMVIILFLSSVGVFYALRFAPGDPAGTILNPLTVEEQREAFREHLGLDDPVYVQYFTYMGRLFRGDLGESINTGKGIGELLQKHGKNSLILGFAALGLSYIIAVPLGVIAAVKRNRWPDQLAMGGAVLGMGIPNFWLALLLVWLLSLQFKLLPSAGCCDGKHLILPMIVLAAEGTAVTMRMVRASMLEQLNQDFVRTLRAKGVPEWKIVTKHVLRNALIPVISLTGLRLGWIVGYAFIVEVIFRWPGVGFLLVDSVLRRDYPVAQFFSLILIFFVVSANWLADISYGLANPRVRRA